MFSLACFFCPSNDFENKSEDDRCPTCGRTFGFPLSSAPVSIGSYRIVKALGRGFYAATYLAEYGRLNKKVVLKVASKRVYDHFGKNFEEECKVHQEVADGTKHLVGISDFLETTVDFAGTELDCLVAVLDYVDGVSLADFLESVPAGSHAAITQIAIDLLQLMNELKERQVYHNDLHAANIMIERLPQGSTRPEAIDGTLRAVAIDLGSAARVDRQDPVHLGDLQAIVQHLFRLEEKLFVDASRDVTEYRVASVLEDVRHMLAPARASQREPDYLSAIRRLRAAFQQGNVGWDAPQALLHFDDSYNAQTLHPWFMPRLLVDPDELWMSSVSVHGPQVITGMRGCGKTMLLRALDIHARIMTHQLAQPGDLSQRLAADGYVGLYVSCNRLLDGLWRSASSMHEPYARLYVAYAREACRALQHLREVSASDVADDAVSRLVDVCSSAIENPHEIGLADDLDSLEMALQHILASLDRGESAHRLLPNPAIAFPQLAEALKRTTHLWRSSQVLFLLDDVSTRHLGKAHIGELLSALMFSNPSCSFKLTTEGQTLELVLKSPGQIESARAGRDYSVFDLGAAVNAKLRDTKSSNGKEFISSVLSRRAELYGLHPSATPLQLLGDVSLASIARTIASTTASSKEKKRAYHGLSALRAVCVGDIGDVISVYDLMLRKVGQSKQLPIAAELQSESLQEYCSRRLYNVNRKDGRLKDFALTFASASHQLLMRSHAERLTSGKGRLRQYNSIYVRLSADKNSAQHDQIRELVDAGVFVLEGGTDTPRTKSRDRDPIQQFVLTYRKLFGLSSFIGLSERDRFELSGPELDEWLNNPASGVSILLRNLGGDFESELDVDDEDGVKERLAIDLKTSQQSQLWISGEHEKEEAPARPREMSFLGTAVPVVTRVALSAIGKSEIDHVVVGLGFEERALVSARRIFEATNPKSVTLIRYPINGHASEIEKLAEDSGARVEIVDYKTLEATSTWRPEGDEILLDVTGLAKGALFRAVVSALQANSRVTVATTKADSYYPLDDEIAPVIEAGTSRDPYALVERLASIWAGESGPYDFRELTSSLTGESDLRVLCASSAAKAERLLSLTEMREFDHISLSVPADGSPRSELADLAAQVVAPDGMIASIDSSDLAAELQFISSEFQYWCVERKFGFELGLTGSKTHAVAAAIASVALPITRVWYVAPKTFDPNRFTSGTGLTSVFHIRV